MILNFIVILLFSLLLYVFHGTHFYWVIDYFGIGMMGLGALFSLGTTIGLLRFPDFYTRMHAAGKGDTLSPVLLLFGAALIYLNHSHFSLGEILVAIKLLVIVNFIFIGSPTATHAMMLAGKKMGISPWTKGK